VGDWTFWIALTIFLAFIVAHARGDTNVPTARIITPEAAPAPPPVQTPQPSPPNLHVGPTLYAVSNLTAAEAQAIANVTKGVPFSTTQEESALNKWLVSFFAAYPKLWTILVAIGALRIPLHSLNEWLTKYVVANLSKSQFTQLTQISGSKNWKRFEFVVHLLTSIKPSVVLGAIQLKEVGTSDTDLKPSNLPSPTLAPQPTRDVTDAAYMPPPPKS
jgi:hypothetical protein